MHQIQTITITCSKQKQIKQLIYIKGLMVVVFGSDERSLNDVQVSSRHCH